MGPSQISDRIYFSPQNWTSKAKDIYEFIFIFYFILFFINRNNATAFR